ncbi:expressed conserved protein [Echinococcus multilocularis]|uniref:Expressed conserved protein n=1 Tax=Echinococcus multilocularis TaxID=6211 RepID=A0A087VWQ4_ECHMU|nr:expressed conserved protein [Echinococcus multilocularis]
MEFRLCWMCLLALAVLICGAQAKKCGSTQCKDRSGFFWSVDCCGSPKKCCYNRRWWPLITTICLIAAAIAIFCCACYCCPCCSYLADCGKGLCSCFTCCCEKERSEERKPLKK